MWFFRKKFLIMLIPISILLLFTSIFAYAQIDKYRKLNKLDYDDLISEADNKSIEELLREMGFDDTNLYEIDYEDLNDDGIDEIYVTYDDGVDSNCEIYTYYTGDLIDIINYGDPRFGCVYNIPNTPYFGISACSSYCQYDEFYTIKNDELVSIASIDATNIMEQMKDYTIPLEYEATIGERTVSVDEYWNYLYSILPDKMVKSMYDYMMLGIDDSSY